MAVDVLLISNFYPPCHIGGYEIAARDAASALVEHGRSVAVLTSDYRVTETVPVDAGIERTLRLVRSFWDDYPASHPDATAVHNADATRNVLVRLKPNVVYAWNQHLLGAGVLAACRNAGVPVVHHIMGVDILKYMPRPLMYQRVLDRARGRRQPGGFVLKPDEMDRVIFLSHYMKNVFESAGVSPVFTRVVHPGVAVDKILCKSGYELDPACVRVAYTGQFAPHKGVMELKQALCALCERRPGARIELELYGGGDPEIEKGLMEPCGITIRNHGFVERPVLYEALQGCDVGVFPSVWEEPFGIAQIELMAAGLPLIATGAGGSGEPLRDGENALVYRSRSAEELCDKLDMLLDDYRELAPRLGREARATVIREFSYQRMSDDIAEAVREGAAP